MGQIMQRMWNFLGFAEDEEGGPPHAGGSGQRAPIFSLHTQRQMEIIVLEPGAFDEAQTAADYLKTHRPIVINLRGAQKDLGKRIVDDTLMLMRALGYDMCSLEFAVRGGVPYAIDFMNPAPDMDVNSLTPHYFDWVVKGMADLVIRLAKEARPKRNFRRGEFLLGRREGKS